MIRPLGGSDEELTAIFLPLAEGADQPADAEFPMPGADDLGDFARARLLHDAARLAFHSGAGPFRSLARISFRPRSYQMVPLVMALRQETVRLLVADDVGVGKTIEALLVIRELLDRRKIRRFAVICLPHLCDQWQQEIRDKIGVEAVVIRSNTQARLDREIQGDTSVYQFYPFQVLSIDYIKSDSRRATFINECPEMVIVDEIHTCARPQGAAASQMQRHALIRDITTHAMNPYSSPYAYNMVADSPESARAEFIRKTYGHLAGAIALFAILEYLFLSLGYGETALVMLGTSRYSWLIVLGAFMLVSWVAESWATNGTSMAMQYAGLMLYTVAEAVIFLPMIALAVELTGDLSLLTQAGLITAAMVLGISAVALTTKKDFSFIGGFLRIAGFVALGLIVASFILPISLGLWFSAAMVVFASGAILYNTSNLIHRYRPGQHVAAALSLFASVALLFWYVLRILMSLRRN